MTDPTALEAFLSKPRYGILTTNRPDDAPIAVPVWFEWDGGVARIFTSVTSPKMGRLEHDARASLLVTNDVDEREAWVAFDGRVTVSDRGGFALAERLAHRYWDMHDPERASTVDTWRKGANVLRVLELRPETIRSYGALA